MKLSVLALDYDGTAAQHDAMGPLIVTRESNPLEIEELRRWCSKGKQVDPKNWTVLSRLVTAQAVALPITEESGGDLIQFTLGSRLTPHVRHREKYVDVPASEGRAFAFTSNGQHGPHLARTLRQFVADLDRGKDCGGYLRRGDFSRWIADVFGDHVLAAELRELEAGHRMAPSAETLPAVVRAIRARYELGPS